MEVTIRLLLLQPSDADPPERLGDWLASAGADLTLCRPATEGLPESLDGFAAVVCLGGAMGANDDADHPWLAGLRQLLAVAVAARLPVLGVCLGGQLLAAATGGAVRRGIDGPEVGTLLVAKRDAAARDPLFAELPLTPVVIQFHYDEIHRLPPGATLLASSPCTPPHPCYPNQAFRVGRTGYGLQFHIETSPATVLSWARRDQGAAAVIRPGQLDPEHLEQVHAELAEIWRPIAARFVALAAGELAPASNPALGSADSPGGRTVLPLHGREG